MKMVTAIVGWQKMIRVKRIAHRLIEVDHCIEVYEVANPGIDRVAVGFVEWAGMVIV